MKNIATAFVKAQKDFSPALKSSTNPHFKSKYADLAACVEAVIDALNNNGIALIQKNHECDDGVIVETVFIHESGELIDAGKLHVPAGKKDPQGYGSALTYARRYSLMAACGIAPEDDDGNAASKTKKTNVVELAEAGKSIAQASIESLNDEQQAAARLYGDSIVNAFNVSGVSSAYEIYEEVKTKHRGETEYITAVWGCLPSNIRTAIKNHGKTLEVAAQA